MGGGFIVAQIQAVLHTIRQKTRVFAAAVVVALVIHRAGWRCGTGRLVQSRYMATTTQGLGGEPGFLQHALGLRHVGVFAIVAGTQHGNLLGRKTELGRPLRLHERQRLQGLERGARKGEPVGVACMGEQFAMPVGNRHRAKMYTFQRAATAEFYEWCEVHGRIISAWQRSQIRRPPKDGTVCQNSRLTHYRS